MRFQTGAIATGLTVRFQMTSNVNGKEAHLLGQWLTAEALGILGSKAIHWNFTKFLDGRDGRVIKRYAPQASPKKMAKESVQSHQRLRATHANG